MKFDLNIKKVFTISIIVILPFLFYLMKLIPKEVLSVEVYGYEFVMSNVLWYLILKFNLIALLTIWYKTCKNWWKMAILIPITIEVFKLISFFNFNRAKFDENDFLTSLPITFPLLIILWLIAKKLKSYLLTEKLRNDLNFEIEEVFSELQKNLNQSKQIDEFVELKDNKNKFSKKEYLLKLIELRNKIIDL